MSYMKKRKYFFPQRNNLEYLLQQNPATGSIWALASKLGAKIYWVMLRNPDGKDKYQGDVYINGVRYNKSKSVAYIEKHYKITIEDTY